jgi:hypothetical protein
MRIEISRLVTSRCLSACAALVALICPGCDVEKIGTAIDRHGTKLAGRNAAIGGVNFRTHAGKDWDWHIISCRLNSGPADISLGTGSADPILTISKNGDQVKVVLRGLMDPRLLMKSNAHRSIWTCCHTLPVRRRWTVPKALFVAMKKEHSTVLSGSSAVAGEETITCS